jgi:hypothetical protein
MDAEETFLTLAEVGIALAGFSGIVAVLGGRAQGSWPDIDRLRLSILLQTSFSAVLWSFAPIVLFYAELDPPVTWSITSGSYALYLVIGVGYRIRQTRAIARSQPELVDPQYVALVVSGVVVIAVLQIINAIILRTLWPHLVAILWALVTAFIQFVRLLRGIWAQPPGPAA